MKKFLGYSLVALSICYSTSCNVLDQAPEASLTPEQVFTDASGVNAALLGSYSALQSGNYMGLRTWALTDLAAGNLRWTGTFPSFAQYANAALLPNNVENTNMWNTIYVGINRANNIIANVPAVDDASLNKDRIIAEAKVLRAYNHLNALLLWGGAPAGYTSDGSPGVPIRLAPTLRPEDADPTPRPNLGEVKAAILADLSNDVINQLPNRGTSSAADVVGRLNREAAIAIRARAHLIFGNYANAATDAQSVISGTGSDLVASYASLFVNRNTTEALWELQFDEVNNNAIAFFFFGTAQGGRNELGIGSIPVEDGDARGPVINPNGSTTQKYTRIGNGDDHVILVRRAEMYLAAAEALVRANGAAGIPQATILLNAVRSRAGLDPVVIADPNDFLNAVLTERRVELAIEGHFWFDLRRTGRVLNLPIINTQNFRALFPVPEREVLVSEGIIAQNDGY